MLCAASPQLGGHEKNCFGIALIVYVTVVGCVFFFYLFYFIFQYLCQLEQGGLSLAKKRKKRLRQQVCVEDLVFTKNPPAKIEWLKNRGERQIEKERFWKKERRNCVRDGKWSKHQLTQMLHQKVFRRLWFHSLDWRRAPGRFPSASHLSYPTQLLCHVGFASPFTISLCPDQVRTICSTALISLRPKN